MDIKFLHPAISVKFSVQIAGLLLREIPDKPQIL